MPPKEYRWYQSLAQLIGSTTPGAVMMSWTAHHFDKYVFKWTKGRATLVSIFAGLPVVMVTTPGAKSGLPRTLPLLGIPDSESDSTFALIASNGGQKHAPAWYYNLKANPRATCTIKGVSAEYVTHEATGDEYQKFWQKAVRVYAGYSNYLKRVGERHIPIMVMQRVTE